MAFYAGQKVVCINCKPSPGMVFDSRETLTLNAIYTVAALDINDDGDPVAQLVELKRNNVRMHWDPWFAWYGQYRFRPVVERKTDISIFTSILTNPKQKILETVE